MRRATTLIVAVAMAATAAPAHAQSEQALRSFFEGRTVRLRLDVPGSAKGLDIYPNETPALDPAELQQRLKDQGLGGRAGEAVVVTKVQVTGDLIEFQFGGGGVATSAALTPPAAAPADEETYVQRMIDRESNDVRKKDLERYLADLRRRKSAGAAPAATSAPRVQYAQYTTAATSGGSRFVLRWRGPMPSTATTPGAVMDALAAYVDFPAELARARATTTASGATPSRTYVAP